MLEKRPILIAVIGYILGILMGLYCKISIVLFYVLIFLVYVVAKNKKRKNEFKLFSIRRYSRYVKILFNKSAVKIIIIFSIISNTIVLFENYKYENLYSNLDGKNCKLNGIVCEVEEKKIKVKITNIKFTKKPGIGNGNIYYKNVNNFAKSEINEKNKIENELQFETTSENETNLDKPILYNNCANPITLSYINQNIKTDYTMTDTQNPITYNGKLLKRCGISINSISTSISFDIEIENNKNQKFKTTVYFDIPYEDTDKSIYDGSIVVEKNTNFNFYRYE